MKTFCTIIGATWLAVFMAGCMTASGPNQTGGAILGGATGAALGAVIGNNSGGHSAEGAVIGGVIGALAGALMGKDIDEITRTHVVQGQPLTLEDIKALARAGVRDDLIISQINASRTVYHLGTTQIIDLKSAGVNDRVIDYMINTPTAYAQPPRVAVQRNYYVAPPPPYPYYYYYPPPPSVHLYWRHGRRWH